MFEGAEIAIWCCLLFACVTDLLYGKVFNLLTLPFLAGGIAFRLFVGGVSPAFASFTAVGTAFLLFFPLYWLKAIAAGDVKLLMAIGAWMEPNQVLHLALVSIVIGAAVGGFLLLVSQGFRASAQSLLDNLKPGKETTSFAMPFAPAFVCAFSVIRIAELRGWGLV